jgi:hypothetical protein
VHPDRKCAVIDVEQQVIVASHHAEAEAKPASFVPCARELPKEDHAIAVVPEELGRPHRMAVDVEHAGTHIASLSRHRATIASEAHARQWLYEADCIS